MFLTINWTARSQSSLTKPASRSQMTGFRSSFSIQPLVSLSSYVINHSYLLYSKQEHQKKFYTSIGKKAEACYLGAKSIQEEKVCQVHRVPNPEL